MYNIFTHLSIRSNYLIIIFGYCVLIPGLSAADIKRGEELHNTNCTSCHIAMYGSDGSGIYTRPDRHIDSLQGLRNQIARCKNSMGVSWPEDQINDVIQYLNEKYYKFDN